MDEYKEFCESFRGVSILESSSLDLNEDEVSLMNPDSVFELFMEANETRNVDLMVSCLETITAFLVTTIRFDVETFTDCISSVIISLTTVTDNDMLAMKAIQLVTAIQKYHPDLMPDVFSDNFVNFCIQVIQSGKCELGVGALICLRNLVACGDEFRDRVMVMLSVECLECEVISKDYMDHDVREEAMNLVCCYAQYPVDEETGMKIVNLCRNCFESDIEPLMSPSLWALVLLLKSCPSISDEFIHPQVLDAINSAFYAMDSRQIIPALHLTRFLFTSNLELPEESYRSFLLLMTYQKKNDDEQNSNDAADIRRYAYTAFKELIIQKPHLLERLMEPLLRSLEDIMSIGCYDSKMKAADLFCTICLSIGNTAFTGQLALANHLPWLVDFLSYDDPDLQLQIIRILINLVDALERHGYQVQPVLSQLYDSGALDLLAELRGEGEEEDSELREMTIMLGTRINEYAQAMEEQPIEPEPPQEQPPRRGPRRVQNWVRQMPIPSDSDDSDSESVEFEEEQEEEQEQPVRMRLWVKPEVVDSSDDDSA